MKQAVKSLLKSLPPAKRFLAQREKLRSDIRELRSELKKLQTEAGMYPPGHFYSPIPLLEDVRKNESRIFDRSLRSIMGVDLNPQGQIELFEQLLPFYAEQPFAAAATDSRRFYFDNVYFGYSDAIILYCMIRHAKPRHIIEIGSGFSSFAMLDTNELFFDNRIRFTLIDPFPDRLRSRLREKDSQVAEIVPQFVQDVELARFEQLAAGDILFVDSSHVSKIASDVNHILFEILPRLAPGVLIHFHDMFYPFEYPKEWIDIGRTWNEDYIVRAFLQFNSAFKIQIWTHFLGTFYQEKVLAQMPLCMKCIGGGLWLKRV